MLVTLARTFIPELRDNNSAGEIVNHIDSVKDISDIIVNRVQIISPNEAENTRAHLNEIISKWVDMAKLSNFAYRANKSNSHSLLTGPEELGDDTESGFPTPWSLRDVDKNSNLFIV